MSGDSQQTLIVTTRSGVRPLGVRGEPLHNAAQQIRRIVRRRLGDTAADLLADPQLHDGGNAIDWYADWPGEVRPLVELEPERRAIVLAAVDRTLKDIARLGESLKGAGTTPEDTGVVGRSIQLAARRPAESFVFLVGERPVVVCWGYEKEAAAGLLLSVLPRAPVPAPIPAPVATPHVSVLSASEVTRLPAVVPVGVPWFRTLLAALPLLLLLLGAAWLLRELLPGPPDLSLATRESMVAPTAPTPVREDRVPLLKASLSSEEARAKALRLELAAAETEIRKRVADCKPPEPPKVEPPKVVEAPKVEPPKPDPPKPPPQTAMAQPKPAPPPPPPPPRRPNDDRLRMPNAPTNDYSFMQGCWRTDPFRHERLQPQAGVSSYCFDASGRGQLEWRRGRTACRTRAQAQFAGDTLQLRDADTVCNDGSQWYADRLVCQRGADNVANCSGSSRNAYGGPVSWMVNLHRIN